MPSCLASSLPGLLRRFIRDRSGNFAIIFAVMLIPVAGMAGLALDYARMASAEERLQAAVDSGIAAAAATRGSTKDMQLLAADFVTSNFPGEDVKVETVVDTHEMRVEARYMLPLSVLAAFGETKTEIVASAELTSAMPFTGGSVGTRLPGKSEARPGNRQAIDERELWRRFNAATKSLPQGTRNRLNAQLRRALAQLGNRGGPVYLSR